MAKSSHTPEFRVMVSQEYPDGLGLSAFQNKKGKRFLFVRF